MTTSGRRYEQTIRNLAIAVFIDVLVVVSLVVLAVRANQNLVCVKTWASAYADRAQSLNALATARQNATDVLIRDVGKKPQDPAKNARDYISYLTASDAYNKASAMHPFPPPPYHCSIF